MPAFLLTALLTLSAAPPGPRPLAPTPFSLPDAEGRRHTFSPGGPNRALVVIFLGVDCPLAKLYAPRLRILAREWRPRGVEFVAIDSNDHETLGDLARYARRHDLGFPLLKDAGNRVADRLGAERTPEAFVLDAGWRVRYQGRIDDQHEVGLQRGSATRHDLAEALADVLAARPVRVPRTEPPGCPIRRADRPPATGSVTWHGQVAAIVASRCQGCHQPGEAGPFSLTDYQEASAWALALRDVVTSGLMPPWGADPRHGKFANDPSLTPREREALLAWVAGGCPEGEPDRATAIPQALKASRQVIADPDLVLSMPEPFVVPASGVIEYQSFVVDPGFKEDRWVAAAEVRPGNKGVVHHCNIFLQPPGATSPDEMNEAGKLGSHSLTVYTPGTAPLRLDSGRAKRIPAGWKVVFVMHYQAVGSEQADQTTLALKFLDPAGVRQEVATKVMIDPELCIPPGEPRHTVSQTWRANQDVLLLALTPHLHLRGRSFRYTLTNADGVEEILLDVPRWDFAWQFRYELVSPVRVSAGSLLTCTAVFDNSAQNRANPDPSATVRAGAQSWDEMFNGYFDVCLADEDLTRPLPWGQRVWESTLPLRQPGVAVLSFLAGSLYLGRRRIARRLGTSPPEGIGPAA